jgi:Cu-processing system permease protein
MTKILIIAKTTMMENSRKQVFHVVTLLTLAVICASTLMSFFTLGVQVKILKDMCMTSILFCGGILAIALAASAIPGELESRTCYPILARSIKRSEFMLGKYFGTLFTVYIGLAVIALAFVVLLLSKHSLDAYMALAVGFSFLEVAVIAAITMCFSTITTPAVAAMLSFIVYVTGTIKIGYFKPLIDNVSNPFLHAFVRGAYHILPNLESFNFKDALVHGIPVSNAYLVQVGIYGVCYTVLALIITGFAFARREM